MRLHRFYIKPDAFELEQEFWLKNDAIRNQWLKVLRYKAGDEVVLFDGISTERLYKLARVEKDAIQLKMVTEFERKLPHKHVYLFFSLLKKDKNEWVIQKCTELGVSNFVPVIAGRSEKTGFNLERAEKIAIEAAEQCGRSDIPHIREPISLQEALAEYGTKLQMLVCEEGCEVRDMNNTPAAASHNSDLISLSSPTGVFIGPEGGWTQDELADFERHGIEGFSLGHLTLRAETAAIAAITKLQ